MRSVELEAFVDRLFVIWFERTNTLVAFIAFYNHGDVSDIFCFSIFVSGSDGDTLFGWFLFQHFSI